LRSEEKPPRAIGALAAWAEHRLRAAALATPRLDAEVLLSAALGDRLAVWKRPESEAEPQAQARFVQFVERRLHNEPVAYILGVKEFWSLQFQVDRRVLIPRPESETLVEAALEKFPPGTELVFADIGCGSGCLAAAYASSNPSARAVAVDISAGVCALARQNIERLGLSERIEVRQGDLLEPLGQSKFSLILANLPYVPAEQMEELPPGVRLYEPHLALNGGPGGLELVRRLVAGAGEHLNSGGWLILEIYPRQAEDTARWLRGAGFVEISPRPDLSGVVRAVLGKKP
jgi:release factor glutamine methyltransferase